MVVRGHQKKFPKGILESFRLPGIKIIVALEDKDKELSEDIGFSSKS